MLFDFSDYDLLLPLVANSLIASALLGIMGGLIGVFVMNRDSSFAVHGISELSFAGASIALLIGIDVVLGSIVGSLGAAILIAILGTRAKDRNSIIAVIMPFGLGVGILALSLYELTSPRYFGFLQSRSSSSPFS
jgi:zinc/manganese transport system permease protein